LGSTADEFGMTTGPGAGAAEGLVRPRPCASFGAVGEQGQSMVEFAVVLPILLVIVTGILSFGVTLNNYMLLTNATNIGARQLAISRGQTLDPCATVAAAVYKAAPVLAKTSYVFKFVLNGNSYTGSSCLSSSTTTGAAAQLVQGSPAQVTITYPCSLGVYGMSFSSCSLLTAQTTELVQ
jgi:Flp pilus assembly protein TadG